MELSVDGEEESGMRFWTIVCAILTISVLALFPVPRAVPLRPMSKPESDGSMSQMDQMAGSSMPSKLGSVSFDNGRTEAIASGA